MRIAFVTPEFVSERRNGGGLGNYLHRMCQVLLDEGHSPEVFVTSSRSERIELDGILVHRVDVDKWKSKTEWLMHASRWLPRGAYAVQCSVRLLVVAAALAAALKRREREVRFDFVQSADFQAVGLFVPRRHRRPHVVRCSCAADLWSAADGGQGFSSWQCRWERVAIRRADKAYAPSRLVSGHYRTKYNLAVDIIRPPFAEKKESLPAFRSYHDGNSRFHLHFGQLRRRKGTEFLAEALPIVWQHAPEYKMIWAGGATQEYIELLRRGWGDHGHQVEYVGKLDGQSLQAVLGRSAATVLPSLVDNLPNTVIESLLLNKPVIGTYNSSVDEIVANGRNGYLVPFGDVKALAGAILRAWRGELLDTTNLITLSPLWSEMQPQAAVRNLLRFVDCAHSPAGESMGEDPAAPDASTVTAEK